MRIAYITQPYPPQISGASSVVQSLAEAMASRGHEVLVIAASYRGHAYTVEKGRLTVLYLESVYNPLRVGQRLMIFPASRILRALRKFQPDLIHSHELLQLNLLGLHYARGAAIPIVLTTHQVPWFVTQRLRENGSLKSHVEGLVWAYARVLLRQFTLVVSPTQTISTLIFGRTGVRSQTISNGVDLRKYRPGRLAAEHESAIRARLGLPRDAPVILHVGQLHSGKRVDRLLRAAARSLRETEAHLLVVGDGPQKKALMKMCRALEVADRVHFTGYITAAQGLADIYRLARVFATASEIETQGIVLLEAAASGLPIAAVRATCIPEIVHDGANGNLAASGNGSALEKNILLLLKDPLKARMMGRAGRAMVESHAVERTADLHEKYYKEHVIRSSRRLVRGKAGGGSDGRHVLHTLLRLFPRFGSRSG